ncbi:adenosylcobinamide-phosphate synthase CbiB [Chelativorans salis]|uniref:Cobalamin biosynthesis protein CobD n=1 Tax=Chelativorans salis TaxID=2978478 RepID=A0ABT2LWT8_9HYPH|nr:adenosylcobinamide-phosphate synthase CbiB [Chelativorans sp. EGI FJ00035]MCT7377659.1 adenosylcobinamide-phosphate synthase CbiB [Chelativorans sp. EGI FJ00035]
MFVLLAFLSLVLELALGYPDRLFRAIGHPVTWIGRLIGFLDRMLNRQGWTLQSRRAGGVAALCILLAVAGGAGWGLQLLLGAGAGLLFTALLASSLIAQRSLASHVEAVASALETEGLEAGRRAVSMIVGRDTAVLDEAGVSRAAIESLAENFSDGVVAPAFWLAVLGLPGALVYKAVNTADSMVGHRTPRHQAFGWAAARFDDLINLPASRLTALLIVAAAWFAGTGSPVKTWSTVRRDAWRHRSPNAGWPEAAMAGALGLALAGPRNYGGVLVDDALMGEGGRRQAVAADIRRALRLYRAADAILIVLMGVLAGLLFLHG